MRYGLCYFCFVVSDEDFTNYPINICSYIESVGRGFRWLERGKEKISGLGWD